MNIYLDGDLVASDVPEPESPYDITGLTAGNYFVRLEYVDDSLVIKVNDVEVDELTVSVLSGLFEAPDVC